MLVILLLERKEIDRTKEDQTSKLLCLEDDKGLRKDKVGRINLIARRDEVFSCIDKQETVMFFFFF